MLISNAVSKSVENSTVCSLMPLSVTLIRSVLSWYIVSRCCKRWRCSVTASVVFDIKCCFWGCERSLASDKYFFPAFFQSQELAAPLCWEWALLPEAPTDLKVLSPPQGALWCDCLWCWASWSCYEVAAVSIFLSCETIMCLCSTWSHGVHLKVQPKTDKSDST